MSEETNLVYRPDMTEEELLDFLEKKHGIPKDSWKSAADVAIHVPHEELPPFIKEEMDKMNAQAKK